MVASSGSAASAAASAVCIYYVVIGGRFAPPCKYMVLIHTAEAAAEVAAAVQQQHLDKTREDLTKRFFNHIQKRFLNQCLGLALKFEKCKKKLQESTLHVCPKMCPHFFESFFCCLPCSSHVSFFGENTVQLFFLVGKADRLYQAELKAWCLR